MQVPDIVKELIKGDYLGFKNGKLYLGQYRIEGYAYLSKLSYVDQRYSSGNIVVSFELYDILHKLATINEQFNNTLDGILDDDKKI